MKIQSQKNATFRSSRNGLRQIFELISTQKSGYKKTHAKWVKLILVSFLKLMR